MKNKNLQLKQKATAIGSEQSTLTSPELDKLSLSEMERLVGGCIEVDEVEIPPIDPPPPPN